MTLRAVQMHLSTEPFNSELFLMNVAWLIALFALPAVPPACSNSRDIALTACCTSPAACLRCWPIGDSCGTVLVVNRLWRAPLTSFVPAMLALHLFGFLCGGERGFVYCSSRGDCGPR